MNNKYIAHYKSVDSPEELYSETRTTLDFPTQISYNKKKYIIFTIYLISSSNQEKNLIKTAKDRGVVCGVSLA